MKTKELIPELDSENIKNQILISNDRSTIRYTLPKNLTNDKYDILRYTISAYHFVMFPSRCFTYFELAKKIRKTHNMNNLRNKACYDILITTDNMTK
jgi:hypothetical protein